MNPITFRLSKRDYNILENRAKENHRTVSEEVRSTLKYMLENDTDDHINRVRTACTIESLVLLRNFFRQQDGELVEQSNQEARKLVKKLYATSE